MDKLFVRKDVYEELLEKGFGKKDYSKLTKKVITDKNGHRRTVFVKNGEQPAEVKQPKAQEGLSDEKRAKYEEMLEKVKAGSDENALFVRGEMLNKKDAIAYLENKLGKKSTEVTQSAKKTDEYKENYLDARNEAGKDIAENNKIQKLSDKIEFSPDEMKMIRETAKEIGYKVGKDEGKLLNSIYSKDKAMYSALTKKNQKAWDESGKTQKTFSSTDLLREKIQSMNGDFGADNSDSIFDEEIDDTNKVSFEDSVKEYNFTDTKKTQFAMNEVSNFYPELKDIVEKRRKAFSEVNDAEKKLKVNPNNKEYQDNFASAYNKLKQADAEYDKASKKALEKAPNIAKPNFSKYMDAKRDVQKFLDKYKQQSEEYEVGKRLRENGGSSILSPMYGLKTDDYTKDPDYIKAQMTIRAYEEN